MPGGSLRGGHTAKDGPASASSRSARSTASRSVQRTWQLTAVCGISIKERLPRLRMIPCDRFVQAHPEAGPLGQLDGAAADERSAEALDAALPERHVLSVE